MNCERHRWCWDGHLEVGSLYLLLTLCLPTRDEWSDWGFDGRWSVWCPWAQLSWTRLP